MRTLLVRCLTLTVLAATAVAHAATSLEANKAIARKVFEEVIAEGKIEENEHIYSSKFATHGLTQDGDRNEDREATKGWRSALPDLKITLTHVIAEGDYVTIRFIAEGHNTGQGNGLPGNGHFMRIAGITIFKLENGQLTDEWTEFDEAGMMRQLGLLKHEPLRGNAPNPNQPAVPASKG